MSADDTLGYGGRGLLLLNKEVSMSSAMIETIFEENRSPHHAHMFGQQLKSIISGSVSHSAYYPPPA